MMKMTVLFGASLLLVPSMASAGAATSEKVPTLAGYPECEDAAHRTSRRTPDPRRSNLSVRDVTRDNASEAHSRTIDEYLSFHARVTEDNGKFTLMPWSALRTHAN
jgi:hypothetical protein